jgi:hypothetical protein
MFGAPVTVALMLEKFVSEPAQAIDPGEVTQDRVTGVTPSKTDKLVMALAGDIEANPAAPVSKAAKVCFLILSLPLAFQVLLPV